MVQKLCLFLQKILLQGLALDDRLGAGDRSFSVRLPRLHSGLLHFVVEAFHECR